MLLLQKWFDRKVSSAKLKRRTKGCRPILEELESYCLMSVSPLSQSALMIEGVSSSPTVATFTSNDPTPQAAANYTATIDWGNGPQGAVITDNGNGSFGVSGTKIYAEEGNMTALVVINDLVDNSQASVSSAVAVNDAALALSNLAPFHPLQGQAFSGMLASFTDGNPGGTAQDYSAMIQWGDGSSSAGTVVDNGNGTFNIVGNHTYQNGGVGLTLSVQVSDVGGATANTSGQFNIDSPPVLAPIPDQTMLHDSGPLQVNLNASDPDGDPLAFQVSVAGYSQAYALNQQLGLTFTGNYYQNWLHANEQWMMGNSGWYFILPNGELHAWDGNTSSASTSPLVATLDPSVYADPSLLWNAAAPTTPAVNASVDATGQVTLAPPAGYVGTFLVTATAADANFSVSQSFHVAVTDPAPVLASIPDQTMLHDSGSLHVALNASNADGDPLSFQVSVAGYSQAYTLKQQLGLTFTGNPYQSFLGANEKWMLGSSGWYFILPNGELHAWDGNTSSASTSPLVATLDPSVYADPSLLWNAAAPTAPAVNASVDATGHVTLTPPAGYVGTFLATATASDATATASQSFHVSVTNQAPVLAAISDQAMLSSQGSLQVPLNANDPDGDPLSFQVSVAGTPSQAYTLKQQLGLTFTGNYYQNWLGANEQWMMGSNGWYFILPNGELHAWDGNDSSTATSPLVATLDPSVYADPSLLWNAAAPTAPAVNNNVDANNNLTLSPPVGYTGTFRVTVTASDGIAPVSRSFTVTVS
jgi:hypothetical protein